MDIAHHKAQLRKELAVRRDEQAPDAADRLLEQFNDHVLPLLHHEEHQVITAYWPMGSEADVRPIMERLHARGFTLGLPVVKGRGQPLTFRQWRPGDAMERGAWNIPVPVDGAPEARPAALLIPFLAFDEDGYRLGYGGGFYDRTLKAMRDGTRHPLAIGIGYECQKIDTVPHEPWDERLDVIITERTAYPILKETR